jgi:hypothetical protein
MEHTVIKRAAVVPLLFLTWGIAPDVFAAGAAANVQVLSVRVDSDGRGIITFSANLGGSPPSCVVSAYTASVAIDTNTAGGKSAVATALASKALGYGVWVYGLGTCSIYGSYAEDMNYLVAQ